MILQSLNELYDRLASDEDYAISPPGFSPQKIGFKIVLQSDGTFLPPQDARISDAKGKLQNAVLEVPGGAKPSGAGVNPCFLWDNQTYLLGRQPEDKKEGFGRDRFEAFRDRHLSLEKEIGLPEFSAVCRFLEKWDPDQIESYPILNDVGTGFGVFQMQGEKSFVHQSPGIRQWWIDNQPKEQNSVLGQCLVTGESEVEIARLHPKIKGAGGQSAGASIVSFNDQAYESYGRSQSFNSPVSESAAFRYGTALNALLSGPKSKDHRIRIGDTTCVFWTETRSETEDFFATFLGGGSQAANESQDELQRERIQRFLDALRSGRKFVDDKAPSDTAFYLLGLAPNAARLSVRFFLRSTIGELLERLRLHLDHMKIVRQFDEGTKRPDPEFPAPWQLLDQTARVRDEIPPLLGGALARAILEGTPYPEGVYTAVLRRIRADRSINYLRAALLKAVLVRNHQLKIPTMLDTSEDTQLAYRYGRLFATLEKIQEEGHFEQTGNKLEKSIRERYFSSASATPAAVMPRLEQLSIHHRRHLKPGRKTYFDRLVAELKWSDSPTDKPKRTMNLEEQGLFILGYYHQRKAFFTTKTENNES